MKNIISLIFSLFFISIINPQSIESNVKHPEWSYNKSIYEVNLRQYTEAGTFKAFEKHLPRLKEMGVGILWLMPIHPIGEKNRKGSLGSYYSVKNYFAVNPEHGSLDDFKSLVKKIHDLDMYVIIDWVANHTSWDNKLIEENPEWYTKDLSGNFVPPIADWHDVVDLNYDNKDLWNYMIGALKFWVEECDIDGYRCDVAGMVPIEFWNEARAELDKIKPVFMLAEDESPIMHEEAFDMTYSWDLMHLMNAMAKGEKNITHLIEYFSSEDKLYPDVAFRMRFTTNHDENSWNGTVFERLGEAAEIFGVFITLIPGMPLLYSGQEAGLNKRLEFFERDPIEWKEHKFKDLYSKLIHLKLENKALYNGERGGEIITVSSTHSDHVFSFIRKKDGDKILAVFNFSNAGVSVQLDNSSLAGNYTNFFTNEKVTLHETENINLEAWGYKVYVKE